MRDPLVAGLVRSGLGGAGSGKKHEKTERIVETARQVLEQNSPMTVRQVYYQLVSRQVIKNNRSQYQAVSNALVWARQEGIIPWEWIEDRTRKPRRVPMWQGLGDFAETARRAYRRDIWTSQENYFEVWLEKDALSGIFEEILSEYGVTLSVGRGYDGWDSIHGAADRFEDGSAILYFGDFDPSGEDMVRSLTERLGFFGCTPEIVKCALTAEDVLRYNLPSDFAKTTDTRRAAFVEKFGDACVELDALPVDALQERIRGEVEARLDLDALAEVRELEGSDRAKLIELLNGTTLRHKRVGDGIKWQTKTHFQRNSKEQSPR